MNGAPAARAFLAEPLPHLKKFIAVGLAALLVACGGGGGVDSRSGDAAAAAVRLPVDPVTTPAASGRTRIDLVSDPGDPVGGGQSFTYTLATAEVQVQVDGGQLNVVVNGQEHWWAAFAMPDRLGKFEVGTYAGLKHFHFRDPAAGGLHWSTAKGWCTELAGSLRVNSAEYVGTELVALDMDFVQQCDGSTGALRGNIRWVAADTTQPPGPVTEVPTTLWAPAADTTPTSGSFVFLESEYGDYVAGGGRKTYTKRTAEVVVTEAGGLVSVHVNGDQKWAGAFKVMNSVSQTVPGWYSGLQRYPYHNPARGGMTWASDDRTCDEIEGWYVVDEITFVGGQLATLDMRFQQRCGYSPEYALRGRIRWDINDTTKPPLPWRPAEQHRWAPAEGAPVPAADNYLYIYSTPGDWVGGGWHGSYSHGLVVGGDGLLLSAYVNGWSASFMGMSSITRLKRGYYPNLQVYRDHNPAKGGMSVWGFGHACNEISGWFAIDHIRHDAAGRLMAVDLRFSQRCEGYGAPLRGALHWVRPS